MTKAKPIWDEETRQPFKNNTEVYTYIPRTSGAHSLGSARGEQAAPAYAPALPYRPWQYYPQVMPAQPQAQYTYYSNPHHAWYSQYAQPIAPAFTYVPSPNYCYNPQPQQYYCAPVQALPAATGPFYDGKRRSNGTLPWYGRTAQEVQEDEWKMRDAYQRSERKKEKEGDGNGGKSIEPKGKPTDQYWVRHKVGGMQSYPLGTIKNNFEGVWQVDLNGWPYLVEE
jgi:hypothetical protein